MQHKLGLSAGDDCLDSVLPSTASQAVVPSVVAAFLKTSIIIVVLPADVSSPYKDGSEETGFHCERLIVIMSCLFYITPLKNSIHPLILTQM